MAPTIGWSPAPGQWIRRGGEDITRGAVVLARGERLTPASLGLAASIGLANAHHAQGDLDATEAVLRRDGSGQRRQHALQRAVQIGALQPRIQRVGRHLGDDLIDA